MGITRGPETIHPAFGLHTIDENGLDILVPQDVAIAQIYDCLQVMARARHEGDLGYVRLLAEELIRVEALTDFVPTHGLASAHEVLATTTDHESYDHICDIEHAKKACKYLKIDIQQDESRERRRWRYQTLARLKKMIYFAEEERWASPREKKRSGMIGLSEGIAGEDDTQAPHYHGGDELKDDTLLLNSASESKQDDATTETVSDDEREARQNDTQITRLSTGDSATSTTSDSSADLDEIIKMVDDMLEAHRSEHGSMSSNSPTSDGSLVSALRDQGVERWLAASPSRFSRDPNNTSQENRDHLVLRNLPVLEEPTSPQERGSCESKRVSKRSSRIPVFCEGQRKKHQSDPRRPYSFAKPASQQQSVPEGRMIPKQLSGLQDDCMKVQVPMVKRQPNRVQGCAFEQKLSFKAQPGEQQQEVNEQKTLVLNDLPLYQDYVLFVEHPQAMKPVVLTKPLSTQRPSLDFEIASERQSLKRNRLRSLLPKLSMRSLRSD